MKSNMNELSKLVSLQCTSSIAAESSACFCKRSYCKPTLWLAGSYNEKREMARSALTEMGHTMECSMLEFAQKSLPILFKKRSLTKNT
eukprot:2815119-Amphidinium_carterae.1